jgi:hypothetical protein
MSDSNYNYNENNDKGKKKDDENIDKALQEFLKRNKENREKADPYAKVSPDSEIVLKFDPNEGLACNQVISERFKDKKGNPIVRWEYNSVITKEGWRKIFSTSKKGAERIDVVLATGKKYIKITRTGSGQYDTVYTYKGVDSF